MSDHLNGTLAQLPVRQWATVHDLALPRAGLGRAVVIRLMELGFVPGERVCIVAEGPGQGGPLAVRVGHTTFALRRHEAAYIQVVPIRA
ncbi:MAG: ferrous iron transport protein A [Flavobacteriales bacterium]|nr:ferrous iron transport protein A [Flavobacteriales bacterium]MBP9081111.1 ferrous iron transport protein A [Flavobacteriales bacterium]